MPRIIAILVAFRIALVLVLDTSPAGAAEPTLRVDDFEDLDLEAATGMSWTALGDWLVGGASSATLTVGRPGAGNRSRGALHLDAHLHPGARGAFAGAWAALRGDALACDLTGYRALRFRVRGTPGRYQAGVRRTEGVASVNFMAPFDATAAWTDVEIAFTALAPAPPAPGAPPFAPRGIAWLGITNVAESPASFALEIDDVQLVGDGGDAPGPAMQKLALTDPRALDRLAFASLARDPAGDTVSPRLPDARELQLAVDAGGRVWFRFALEARPPDAFGVNVALDIDGDPANGGAWWGLNKQFHYDIAITAYLSRGAAYWQGPAGIADAAQLARFVPDGLSRDVRVALDPARRTIAVGVPRAALGLRPDGRVRLIGTVGSSFTFNDDVPADGALDVVIPAGPAPTGPASVSQ